MPLKRTFSGLRGIWKKDDREYTVDSNGIFEYPFLSQYVVERHVDAFLNMLPKGSIVIGRDTRPSGDDITEIAISRILRAGFDVIEVGIVPTPTVEIVTKNTDAVGGIIITASHNPPEYNGLKFLSEDGMFLKPEAVERLLKIADSDETIAESARGKRQADITASKTHVQRIMDLPFIESADDIRVLYDANGGAGASVLPLLLKQMGCRQDTVGGELDGIFHHPPVPSPENLAEIAELVKKGGYDIGLTTDPDADRLALIDELGSPLSEELTLAIAIDFYLSMEKTPIVVNLSTSSLIEHIAQKHGVDVHRTQVGEINVSTRMAEIGSKIGGEGNGGVILPAVHPGRDAATGAALVLCAMKKWNRKLSEIVADYPERYIVKTQLELPSGKFDIDEDTLKGSLSPTSINHDDGLWMGFGDGFLHIRASNTEPILRIIAESSTEEEAKNLILAAEEHLSI